MSNSIETLQLIPVLVYTVVPSESPCDPLLFYLVAWYIALFFTFDFFLSFVNVGSLLLLCLNPLICLFFFFSSLAENI